MKEISIGELARRSRLSLKARRLYDGLGVLVPSRVDQASGYCDPADATARIAEHWRGAEAAHAGGPSDPGVDLAIPFAVER